VGARETGRTERDGWTTRLWTRITRNNCTAWRSDETVGSDTR